MKFNDQVFEFVGPGDGIGSKHNVISAEKDCIVTWSIPGSAAEGGYSWLGTLKEFGQQFRKLSPC